MTIQKKQECFGDLKNVFPMGDNGLRSSPETCLNCPDKTECLRAAMQGGGGLAVQDEKVDRAYDSGAMGFFERWARKKSLHTKKNKKS